MLNAIDSKIKKDRINAASFPRQSFQNTPKPNYELDQFKNELIDSQIKELKEQLLKVDSDN